MLENGDVAEVGEQPIRKAGRVRAGRVHVFAQRPLPPGGAERADGPGGARDRRTSSFRSTRRAASRARSRSSPAGVLDETLDAHLLAAARNEALAAIEELARRERMGRRDADVAEAARQAVRRSLARVLGFKPVTTATVLRVRR